MATMHARDAELETPKGVWSDNPPAPTAGSAPPVTSAAALKQPPVPAMVRLRPPAPPRPALNGEHGEGPVTPDVACRVEPVRAIGTLAPPAKAPSEPPLKVYELSKRPKALLNPWESGSMLPPPPRIPSVPSAPEARRPDLRSGGIGFALGLAVAAAVAFAMWPRPDRSVAGLTEPAFEGPAAIAGDPSLPEADVALAELDAPMVEQQSVQAQPALDVELAGEPVAEPLVMEAPVAARPGRAPRPRPALAAVEPADETEPVLAAEPTVALPTSVPALELDLPATPTREDVARAIQTISSQLRDCAPDYPGHVADIRFTFVSSGRAAAALVPNSFGGPAERSCVARVARTAHVPAFTDERLVVSYPIQF